MSLKSGLRSKIGLLLHVMRRVGLEQMQNRAGSGGADLANRRAGK
jgi:hypothetical protein